MNDAIALLAISQLVCLGALFYLYMQLQEMKKHAPARRQPSARVHRMPGPANVGGHSAARAAQAAYAAPAQHVEPAVSAARNELASLVARSNGVIDIQSLARRMRKSEEEVRLLLRRQGIAS
ncbi:MAG: hypothetical protein AB7N24_09245 [Dehalococcoidia bacterium]